MAACRERAPSGATAPLPRLATGPGPPQAAVPPSSNRNLAAAATAAAGARGAGGAAGGAGGRGGGGGGGGARRGGGAGRRAGGGGEGSAGRGATAAVTARTTATAPAIAPSLSRSPDRPPSSRSPPSASTNRPAVRLRGPRGSTPSLPERFRAAPAGRPADRMLRGRSSRPAIGRVHDTPVWEWRQDPRSCRP